MKKRALLALGAALSIAVLAQSGGVTLQYIHWDDPAIMQKVVTKFQAANPNIKVEIVTTPYDGYDTKLNTLIAADRLPDLGYLREPTAYRLAEQGKLVNIAEYFSKYPELRDRLPQAYYYYAPGKTFGTNTGVEIMTMFYSRKLFRDAGLPMPPANAAKAWTWTQFVEVARKLTVDKNGKNALQAGFDPNNIVQYGVKFQTSWAGWYPFVRSAGGDIADASGRQYTLNSPAAVDAFQKLQDLIYKFHVAATPAQNQTINLGLDSGKLAMDLNGQWMSQNYGTDLKLDYSVGVLPKIVRPTTIIIGAPTVIFASTKHREEAVKFYLAHNDPDNVPQYSQGLWMPLEKKYYTQQAFIDKWTNNAAHPAEYRTAVIDYTLNNAVQSPTYRLKNFVQIEPVLTAGIDDIWSGKKTAKQALDAMANNIQPLLQGRWPAK